jgi:hypothetical protein
MLGVDARARAASPTARWRSEPTASSRRHAHLDLAAPGLPRFRRFLFDGARRTAKGPASREKAMLVARINAEASMSAPSPRVPASGYGRPASELRDYYAGWRTNGGGGAVPEANREGAGGCRGNVSLPASQGAAHVRVQAVRSIFRQNRSFSVHLTILERGSARFAA